LIHRQYPFLHAQAGCPISPLPRITQGHRCGGGLLILCGDVKTESLEVNFASETAPRTLFDNVRTMIHIQTLFFMVKSETVAAISSPSDELLAEFLG
jgi:hypothetical protein